MSCPDSECHDNLSRIGRCTEEIKKMLPTYLTKATAKWAIGLFFTLLIAFGIAYGNLTVRVTRNSTILEKMPTKGDIYRIVNKKLSEEEKRKMMSE